MKALRLNSLVRVIVTHPWSSLRDALLLSALMSFAVLVARHYDLFAFLSSLAGPDRTVTPGERVVLTGLFLLCIGVFIARRLDEQRYDVGRQAELEREMRALRKLAMQDPLTGLPNRRALLAAIEAALVAPRGARLKHAFFLLDLNGFKEVNDSYGHVEGDEVLRVVVERLRRVMRPSDMLARLGGDEFGVVAHGVDADSAMAVGARFAASLATVIRTEGHSHDISAAIGAAIIPDDGNTVEAIVNNADLAMYRAKEEPSSAVVFYDASLDMARTHKAAG